MLLRRVCIACALFVASAEVAGACDTAGFKGLDGLRLHRPVPGPIASGFGMRQHPLLRIPKFHYGLDFAAARGDPVQATAKGRISFAGPKGEYGNLVMIEHGDGLASTYGHLSRIGVKEGDCVGPGAVIGPAGSTGMTAEVIVHLEVHVQGKHVDPAPVIDDTPR